MTPMIRTAGLTKRFGRTVALENVDLQIARGECLGLAGPNGGGRSTLLRILATLVAPSTGLVEIDGIDAVRRVYDVRSRLVYVGGDVANGHGLSVRDYLDFVRTARHTSTAAGTLRDVDAVLRRAGLPSDASVDALSSGLRQRLSLAAAFLINVEVLLLDDPFRAIDPGAHSQFVQWLCEIRDRGTTLVVALNDERDMKTICHSVVQLEAGHLTSRSRLKSAMRGVSLATLAAGEA